MSYQNWTKEAPFQTRDGRTIWPVYAPGAHGSKTDGGTIYVHDQDIDLDDVEYPPGARRRVGQLTFQRHEIAYVEVNEAWQRQHVAKQMYELAKQKDPQLRHSTRHRSPDGEQFVRGTDPDQARPNPVLDQPPAPQPKANRQGADENPATDAPFSVRPAREDSPMTTSFDDVRRTNRRYGHATAIAAALVSCLAAAVLKTATALPATACTLVAVAGVLVAAILWPVLPAVLDRRTGAWS